MGIPNGSSSKESAWNAGNMGDEASIPGLGRFPGERNSNPLQYSCLENPMDRGAWWATVQSTAKSRTQLSDWACSGSLAPEMEWFLTRCKLDGLVVLSEMVIQSFHHYVLIHSFPFFFCHLVFPFPPPPHHPHSPDPRISEDGEIIAYIYVCIAFLFNLLRR